MCSLSQSMMCIGSSLKKIVKLKFKNLFCVVIVVFCNKKIRENISNSHNLKYNITIILSFLQSNKLLNQGYTESLGFCSGKTCHVLYTHSFLSICISEVQRALILSRSVLNLLGLRT